MARIVGLNKKYFPQSNPLDNILTPQAQAVMGKPAVKNAVIRPTSPDTVSYDKPSVFSAIRDGAKVIAEGVRGGARFAKRTFDNRTEVKREVITGLDLGTKQTTNSLLGFLSRPKTESSFKSIKNDKPLFDFETKIAPKMRDIIAKNNKIIAETPRSFPTSGKFLDKIKDPRFVFGVGSQQLPNFGAVLGAGLVGGVPAAIGTGFMLESQAAYEDAKAQGLDEEKARLAGAGVGFVNSLLEVIPVLKFLDDSPAGQQAKKTIFKYAKDSLLKTGVQALEEGGTEYLQEVTANAVAMTYNENRGLFDNAAESGFFGALTGGGVGAAGSVVSPNVGLSIKDESKYDILQNPKTGENFKVIKESGMNSMIESLKTGKQFFVPYEELMGYKQVKNISIEKPPAQVSSDKFKPLSDALDQVESRLEGDGYTREMIGTLQKEMRNMDLPTFTKSLETIIKEMEGNRFASEGLIDVWKQAKQALPKELSVANPKQLSDPLHQEALKYKSVDEFVNSQKSYYHGTNKKFDNFDFSLTGKASGEGKLHGLEGSWFVDNKNVARGYGKNLKEVKFDTTDFHTVDAKGKSLNDFRNELWDAKKLVKDEGKKGLIVKNLVDNADYTKSDIGDHIFVVDKSAIKPIDTNSSVSIHSGKDVYKPGELVYIYNKAHEVKAKKPAVPLQEKISKAEANLQRLGFERDNLDTKFDSKTLEDQYQAFKKLVNPQKLDTIQDDTALKAKVKASPEQIDNMLYSQELNASEVFDMFKERRFQEMAQRGEKGRINQEEQVVKKELTKLEKVAKARQEKQDLINRVKDIYDKQVAKIKSAKDILTRRREFIKAVQKQFELSDNDLKSISQRDIRLMNDFEFKQYLDNIRVKSEQLAVKRSARNALEAQINEKELNIEPLRQALKLPRIHNMSLGQLVEFDKILEPYQKGDVFLSKRKLETIDQTDLKGIRTYREARDIFNKKYGTDLKDIKAEEFDRLTGNAGLSEKNPFYKVMIQELYQKLLVREQEYLDIENKINSIASKFKTGIVGKLIPQQKNIVKWFEAEDKSTVDLTPAEAEAVRFMQAEWIKARDYLIKQKALKKGISSDNYYTHVRRTFLEAVKEDGLVTAVKEIFKQQEQDQQTFEILDQDTGQILPLQKFFQFALSRSGNLKPSANVVGAFLTYMKTFKKKQAIDESFPTIMTYADAFTPNGTTKEGVLLNGSLKKFAKEWLNNQKGRRVSLVMKQGGKGETILNVIKRGVMLLDLGFNLTVNAATQVGEQAVQFQLLGNKAFALAKIRAASKKGKRITEKYRSLIGKNPWKQLIEPARKVGDRANLALFVLFQDANVRRTRNALLGMMTPEEFQSETLSPERLAEIRLAVSRYGMVEGAGSIIGATPEAKVFTMYKNWAMPIIGTSIRNIQYLSNYIRSRGKLNQVEAKRALIEAGRIAEVVLFVSIIAMAVGVDDEDDSMLGKLKKRAYQESMTIIQAMSPTTLFTTPRLLTFLDELAKNLTSIMKMETYQATKFGEYQKGDLQGLNRLKKQLTPRAVKQFEADSVKTEQDVAKEILDDLKSGKLDESAAEEKLNNELKKIEAKKKEERFLLPPSEYAQDLLDRLKAGEVTEAQAEKELGQYEKKAQETFDSADESSFIDKVVETAKALGTDPITASIFLFEGERIRRVDNGAIIVERMPIEESQALKKEWGATDDLILDHTIPLQLGGSNREKDKLIFLKSNLKLVSKELWESYTPVENYLGDKLRAGMITKKEAQKLIKDFKEGKISKEEVMKK